jgi:predicted Zn-dependent protease
MATLKKKNNEVTTSRVAARPQAERRVEVAREPAARVAAPSFQDVSRRAFEIWERNGRLSGRDLEDWLQAEAELRGSAR